MISEKEKKKIVELIQRRYQSLENPDFSFVSGAISAEPYQRVAQKIMLHFEIEDDTDPNDDVSFGYVLTQGKKRWVLRISMIGPYAVLLRLNKSKNSQVISFMTPGLSESEKELMTILSSHHIHLLDHDTLLLSIPLKLFNTEPENTRLYQALFVDSDVLPWESISRHDKVV